MLYLELGKNKVIYTSLINRLDSSDILVAYSFLIVITNDMSKYTATTVIPSTILQSNIDSNLSYYPLKIISSGTPNALLSEILLKNTGYHTYKIYYQNSTTNIIYPIPNSINNFEVENGKALVYNANSEVQYKEQVNGNPNNFIYVP